MNHSYNLVADYELIVGRRETRWLDALQGYHPAVGRNELGKAQIIITIENSFSMDTAWVEGREALRRATGMEPQRAQIMSTTIFDELTEVGHPDYVGVSDAAEALGVSRQRVLQLVNDGKLPAIRVGTIVGIPQPAVQTYATAAHGNPAVGIHAPRSKAGQDVQEAIASTAISLDDGQHGPIHDYGHK